MVAIDPDNFEPRSHLDKVIEKFELAFPGMGFDMHFQRGADGGYYLFTVPCPGQTVFSRGELEKVGFDRKEIYDKVKDDTSVWLKDLHSIPPEDMERITGLAVNGDRRAMEKILREKTGFEYLHIVTGPLDVTEGCFLVDPMQKTLPSPDIYGLGNDHGIEAVNHLGLPTMRRFIIPADFMHKVIPPDPPPLSTL